MPIIGRFRSPGAKACRAAALVLGLGLAAGLAPSATQADAFADGQLAFAARDYPAAAALWQKAAKGGSAEATLQLGLMTDLGLGMARNPARAFGYYVEAARQGVPEAALNAGVMLDTGTGVAADSTGASVWYARAALGGSKRAAFNLGLMYRDGSGVPVNADLAAYWLGQAADGLPAAAAALRKLNLAVGGKLAAPLPLSAEVVTVAGKSEADLVWTSAPGPQHSGFVVQMIGDSAAVIGLWAQATDASAVRVAVPAQGALWRIVRVDPAADQYLASPWQHQIAAKGTADPRGVVAIEVNPTDARAAAVAGQFAQTLRASGLMVSVSADSGPIAASAIRYRYRNDASLAGDLAGFLPGFTANAVALTQDLAVAPGEVVVQLVLAPLAGVSAGPISP